MKLHYQNITSYRVLPPRMRIIYPEGSELSPTERQLRAVDDVLNHTHAPAQPLPDGTMDLVSLVWANQAGTHASNALHVATLIAERYRLAEKHLADIQWRLDEAMRRKPLQSEGRAAMDDGKLTDVEKQIIDLEKQTRDVQLQLWRDALELRKELVDSRREYRDTRNRMTYLTGRDYGGQ